MTNVERPKQASSKTEEMYARGLRCRKMDLSVEAAGRTIEDEIDRGMVTSAEVDEFWDGYHYGLEREL